MRGHHVSCFLSQLLRRQAQRGSIAAAFREHSPSRPSRLSPLPGPSSAPLHGACQLPRPARAPRRRLPRSPSPDRPTASPGHHPAKPSAARFEAKPGRRGRERVCLWGCCGAARGQRPKTRRGAPATRGRARRGAQAGPGAQARAAAHLPRGDPARPSRSPRLPEPQRLHHPLLPARFRRKARRAAQTRLFRTRATVSVALGFKVFETSFLRAYGLPTSRGQGGCGSKMISIKPDSFNTQPGPC